MSPLPPSPHYPPRSLVDSRSIGSGDSNSWSYSDHWAARVSLVLHTNRHLPIQWSAPSWSIDPWSETAPIRVKMLIFYVGHIGVMATSVEVRPSHLHIQLIGLRWRRINSVSSYSTPRIIHETHKSLKNCQNNCFVSCTIVLDFQT